MTRLPLTFFFFFAIFLAYASSENYFYDWYPKNSASELQKAIYSFWLTLLKIPSIAAGVVKFLFEYNDFNNRELRDTTPLYNQEYDFIVVGAGAAGATIASRLSEIPNVSVLLIEAGEKEYLLLDIPLAAIPNQLYTAGNWGYLSEPSNDYCRAFENNQCRMFQGKIMGGTSVMNAMLAVRGNRLDYDKWAHLTGDNSWNYDNMLKYFKKLEKLEISLPEVDPKVRGYNGPVHIKNPPGRTPLANSFIRAGVEMGFQRVDYNGRDQTGFGYIQTNQINGERMSTNRAYLKPNRNRKNLFVTMRSHVNKVLIDPVTKAAYGVEFTKNGRKIEVLARKEVILTAGAINTPKLLMLSGIGPAEHLQKFNINVLKDAPVGKNLMDHVTYSGLHFLVNQSVAIVLGEFVNPGNTVVNDFLLRRKGLLTIPTGCEGMGYVNVDDFRPENKEPTTEFMYLSLGFLSDSMIHQIWGMKKDFFQKFIADKLQHHAWSIWPLLLQPKSRGEILLKSADPYKPPRIIPNYYSDPEDVRVSIKAIRKIIELSKTNAMQQFGSVYLDRTVPGCENYVPDSDDYWECALRSITVTMWHFSGTAKMGRESDPSAVVNTRLQVKGIKNLRIGDASVFPYIPRAHTHIPVIAVAEKFSDILKQDWGYID